MKCALELAVTADEAKKARIAVREKAVAENTIEWCETALNEDLEHAAKSENHCCVYPIRFSPDGTEFIQLESYVSQAGNSYYVDTNGWKNWSLLKSYLEQYCYKVEYKRSNLRCSNGYNFSEGALLTISFYPSDLECLN